MVEIWPDLVVFVAISVVFSEIYLRIKIRRAYVRAVRGLQAFAAGEDTADARMIKNVATASLGAVAHVLLERDEAGKWHLSKVARTYGAITMAAVGELVKVPPGAGGILGMAAGGELNLDQLVAVGISKMPKKQQGIAAIVYGVVKPFLPQIQGAFAKITGGSSPPKPGEKRAASKPAPTNTKGGDPFLRDLELP